MAAVALLMSTGSREQQGHGPCGWGDIPGEYGPHPSLQAHPLVVSIL